jgi:signal transduction histidine kinase
MTRRRGWVIAGAGLIYMGFSFAGYPCLGPSALLPSILLCGLAAWLHGWKAGLLAAALTHPYHIWLMSRDQGSLAAWPAALDPGGIAAQLCAVAIGCSIRHNRIRSLEMTANLKQRIRERHAELERISQHVAARSEAERSRLSEALCHIVARQQTVLYYHSEALMNFLAYREAPQTDAARKLMQVTGESIDQVRAIREKLCSDRLLDRGIGPALHDLCRDVQERAGTRFSVSMSGSLGEIPAGTALNIYRIAYEAVTNALRHGRATHIRLSLHVQKPSCTLEIINNGIPLTSDPDLGLGMKLMQQRIEIIHAVTRLETTADGHTRFECVIPLRASSQRCPSMQSAP